MTDVVTEDAPTTDTESVDLGDAGKKAIAAERRRADTLEKELKALRLDAETRANAELSELERFKKENEELRNSKTASELESIRYSVALEKGLPAALAARLQGTDRDSFSTDADNLLQLVGSTATTPRPDPSQGPHADAGTLSPAQQLADVIRSARG